MDIPAGEQAAAPEPFRWVILAGVWVLYCGFGFTTIGLAPLIAPITRDLAMNHSEMGTVLGVWQLIFIASAVPCGILFERLGARWALLLAAAFIAASGLLRGLADDYTSLLLAVCVFGFGAPLLSVGAPKIISLWFGDDERGLAMGIYITSPSLGGILALTFTNPFLLPLFDDDWRRVLMLWAGFTLAAGLIWFAIASHPTARAMERRLAAEVKLSQTQVLLHLLQDPVVRLVLAMSVGIFLYNHGLNSWLPELLRVGGLSPVVAGYLAAVPAAVGMVSAILVPRLALPHRRFLILGLLASAAGAAMLLLLSGAPGLILFGLILQGVARGSLMTIAILILIDSKNVGPRHAGTAAGLYFSAAEVGGVSGPVILGVLYDGTGDFTAGLWFLVAVAALILAGNFWLRRLQKSSLPE